MNFRTNCLTAFQTTRLLPIFFAVLLPVFLAGCASGLSELSANDATYFRNKIETTLGGNGYIKRMVVLEGDGTRSVVITLNVAPENEENSSLKVMRALSRDPLLPSVDKVSIAVEQTQAVAYSRQLLIAVVQGALQGATGLGTPNNASQEEVLTFSVVSTRDALLKGKDPIVVIRNAFFVSGPYEGQSTNSLWITEKKSDAASKQEAPTKQNGSPGDDLAKDK